MSTLSTLAGNTNGSAAVTERKLPARPERIRGLKPGERVDVLTYDARLDPQSRRFLYWFWGRLHDAGLLALYFPHDTEASFPEFVKMLSGGTNVILVLVKNEAGEVVDTLGLATWGPMQLGLSQVGCAGFLFLPEFWDAKATVEAAHRIEQLWFEEMPQKLDLLLGIIARDNVLAQRFMSRIGWTLSGSLPGCHLYAGQRSDATIWYLTREQFEKETR